MKLVPGFQVLCLSHSLQYGLAVRSKPDLCSVCKTHHVKLVKYVEPQEYHISFSHHFLRNVLTSSTYLFGYIDVNYPKERSPEVWYIPPIYIYIYIWQLPFNLSRSSILWNSKCHNPLQKGLQLVFILCLINSINTVPSFLRSILMLLRRLFLYLPGDLFLADYPTTSFYSCSMQYNNISCMCLVSYHTNASTVYVFWNDSLKIKQSLSF
jgi:hypothetical protein